MNQPVELHVPDEGPAVSPTSDGPVPVGRTFLRAPPDLHARYAIGEVLVQPMPEGAVMDPGALLLPPGEARAMRELTREPVELHIKAIVRGSKA
ncbi:hypothetical protein [Zoogloea sp.]|uniref:hypothetical protein n=1 Tax=Zoogloea sp. TaxID=49181 RepID=UPI001416351B|nr:MAG: hypothetical protein F9K15_03080 [Zoogloea sp.]